MYALIVFKDIHFSFKRENIELSDYERTSQHNNIRAGTGNIYTSILVYKTFYSGNIAKKNNHNI